jgi:D-alanine-D-alanine ligase
MTKINKHIEIVRTDSKHLSSMSQLSSDAVLKVLTKSYKRVGITIINDLVDLNALVSLKPDLVFLGLEFIYKEKFVGFNDGHRIWVSEYLDDHNISYTGSNKFAHQLGRNKSLAKQRAIDFGLNTSPFYVVKQDEKIKPENFRNLKFPLFIKPLDLGGGIGIDDQSIVNDFRQLESKINSISIKFFSDSLVEEYLSGREFSVAILMEDQSSEYMVMPIELVAPPNKDGNRILGSDTKKTDSEQAIRIIDELITSSISELAIDVFHVLGGRDYGRIDIRLNEFGIPQFLEANLIPSLIDGYGSFPKACLLNIGLEHESMILRIASLGLLRNIDDTVVRQDSKILISNLIALPA